MPCLGSLCPGKFNDAGSCALLGRMAALQQPPLSWLCLSWVGKTFWLPSLVCRASDTQMNYSSHNMDVAIATLLVFVRPAILGDLSRGRTIEVIVGLLYTPRNRLWLLTRENILLF